ncbi:ABC-type transport auxiliary lipoprotein family protein [Microvirga calopogonii]|uniref:ABC-type transport auxiliary lipoprotein family protein n=1 Tax=Microvirga calopogonii TaxID=2078013 RepID=UPI000E0DE582|nr:ABC-type transport auxiliary lipoprotein family protein [Microvirga calopogonii]
METQARYSLIGLFTLCVIAAAFGFVYWLRGTGGFGERETYRVVFESPVTGVLPGSPVLFNGIAVGDVTELRLNPDDPNQVIATLSLDRSTPIRSDTQAGLVSQGLMGAPSIALQGGTPAAPPPSARGGTPVLKADPVASQDLSQAAREALRRLDALLADNAEPLHGILANLSTFSEALARNSGRLDQILEALERLGGGAPAKAPARIYDLSAPHAFPPNDKIASGQLVIPEPSALVLFDTQKILVRPQVEERAAFDAQWSDSLPKLVQAKIIQSFENANYPQAVARPTEGLTADYQLLIDIRSFQVMLLPGPRADVEFSAKILAGDGRIVGAHIVHASVPVQATDAAAAVAGLNEAFGEAATELVLWVSSLI